MPSVSLGVRNVARLGTREACGAETKEGGRGANTGLDRGARVWSRGSQKDHIPQAGVCAGTKARRDMICFTEDNFATITRLVGRQESGDTEPTVPLTLVSSDGGHEKEEKEKRVRSRRVALTGNTQ